MLLFGGQTVILGKIDFEIGNVSVVVAMGDFSQSVKDLLIRILAVTNPPTTTPIQKSLMTGVLMVEM